MAYVARSIAQIQAQILAQKAAQPALVGLTSTSKAAYWNLWAFIFAVAQSLLEQIFVIYQASLETTVSSAVSGTIAWIQAQVLLFQDGNTVQIGTDLLYAYPLPAFPTPITSAAVVASSTGALSVKVAASGAPLTAGQVTELSAYLLAVLPAGQIPTIVNAAADKLQLFAVIYYNGQSNSVIQTTVQAAVTAYLTLLPFNGLIRVSDIERAILAVPGVTDVTITTITVTPAVGSVVNMVTASQLLLRSYASYAGYLQIDGAAPLATSLTYQVANQ